MSVANEWALLFSNANQNFSKATLGTIHQKIDGTPQPS